jgi:hypothetical protein
MALREAEAEGWGTTLLQIGVPFLVAGLGMVAAGLLLDTVQHWPVFQEVPELFILVPALLGLKVVRVIIINLISVSKRYRWPCVIGLSSSALTCSGPVAPPHSSHVGAGCVNYTVVAPSR